MDISKYEFQSDFAKHYIALGREEGRITVLVRLLTQRFGPLSEDMQARVRQASIDELDLLCERVLTAALMENPQSPWAGDITAATGISAQMHQNGRPCPWLLSVLVYICGHEEGANSQTASLTISRKRRGVMRDQPQAGLSVCTAQ